MIGIFVLELLLKSTWKPRMRWHCNSKLKRAKYVVSMAGYSIDLARCHKTKYERKEICIITW